MKGISEVWVSSVPFSDEKLRCLASYILTEIVVWYLLPGEFPYDSRVPRNPEGEAQFLLLEF